MHGGAGLEKPGDIQVMVVETSSVHTSRFVLHMISLPFLPDLFIQGGRSDFGTFWLQEWLQDHLSSPQRGQGDLMVNMVALGFSWSPGLVGA